MNWNGLIIGETAIDLTDPEDFRMMAILRNTEVPVNSQVVIVDLQLLSEHHGLLCNLCCQVSVERDRRLSLGPEAHKVLKEEEGRIRVCTTSSFNFKGAPLASAGEPGFAKRLCIFSKVGLLTDGLALR